MEEGFFVFGDEMGLAITKHPFRASDLAGVQGLYCGEAAYEKEVADWIKGNGDPQIDCALTSMGVPEDCCRVWLYKSAGGELIGYGTLAKRKWRWQGKNDPHVPVSVIIWVGLDAKYHGKPEGPREDRFSFKILDDLIAEANADSATHPVLGLLVHKDNVKAIKLYERFNFDGRVLSPRLHSVTKEIEYLRMFLILNPAALLTITSNQKRQK